MDREWALGQNGRSFPRWSSLLSTRPALLPWLRLVWKDRSKDDLTKPRFCPEKRRPGHHARPRECGLVSLAVSGPNRELRGGKAHASTAGADQKKRISPQLQAEKEKHCVVGVDADGRVFMRSRFWLSWGDPVVSFLPYSCVNVKVRC